MKDFRFLRPLFGALFAVAFVAPHSSAESLIKQPGRHPRYSLEAEPHLEFALGDPPGLERDADSGVGLGARFSIPVAPDGLIRPINDSVAVGFGMDYLRYSGGTVYGYCKEWRPGPAGTQVCVDTTAAGGESNVLLFPVVFQWNFWLTEKFSVFGEPGMAIAFEDDEGLGFAPIVFWAGGRFHFAESAALTLRIGYPSASLGVSLLL